MPVDEFYNRPLRRASGASPAVHGRSEGEVRQKPREGTESKDSSGLSRARDPRVSEELNTPFNEGSEGSSHADLPQRARLMEGHADDTPFCVLRSLALR